MERMFTMTHLNSSKTRCGWCNFSKHGEHTDRSLSAWLHVHDISRKCALPDQRTRSKGYAGSPSVNDPMLTEVMACTPGTKISPLSSMYMEPSRFGCMKVAWTMLKCLRGLS